jgi:hypothetical protein
MTRLNSARGPAIGHDHTKAIEACQFLASVVSGVEGEPGFRDALAAARAQEAIMRVMGVRTQGTQGPPGVTT